METLMQFTIVEHDGENAYSSTVKVVARGSAPFSDTLEWARHFMHDFYGGETDYIEHETVYLCEWWNGDHTRCARVSNVSIFDTMQLVPTTNGSRWLVKTTLVGEYDSNTVRDIKREMGLLDED